MHLTLPYKDDEIVITDESELLGCDAGSAYKEHAPEQKYMFGGDDCRPSTCYQIAVRHGGAVLASRILFSAGGVSGVHARSAFVRGDACFVAIGPFVCALELPTLRLLWHVPSDTATCFGVYDAPGYASIISHGEIEIARLTYSGQILWAESGRDIFSEGFELHAHHAEAIDFEGIRYKFALETGRCPSGAT